MQQITRQNASHQQILKTCQFPTTTTTTIIIIIVVFLHETLQMVMGLGHRFCVFSSYGSLLCILHFVVWSFVWTLILSFFFSCCLAGCFFFLSLFI